MGLPKYTIYCHIHIASGRRYVGLTKLTMMKRWNQHLANAKAKRGKGCRHFWNAIRKYGKDAFSHEILEVCHSLEVANLAEESWIEFFSSRDPLFGFNIKKGGSHVPHPDKKNPWDDPEFRVRNAEGLERAKAALLDPENRKKAAAARVGVPLTLERREQISLRQKGKKRNPESIAKTSATLTGRKLTPEHKSNIGNSQRGKKHDPEHIAKVAEANRARPKSQTCKQGHSLENAYLVKGRRFCKLCQKRRSASYYLRKKVTSP